MSEPEPSGEDARIKSLCWELDRTRAALSQTTNMLRNAIELLHKEGRTLNVIYADAPPAELTQAFISKMTDPFLMPRKETT